MPQVPSGVTAENNGVTAIETSMMVGVQQWVISNDKYVRRSSLIIYLLMIGSAILIIGLVPDLWILLIFSLLLFGVALLLKKNNKTTPIQFPIPIIAEHDWVYYRTTAHLHSTSKSAQIVATAKKDIPRYHTHLPKIADDENESQHGIREFSDLSKNTLSTYSAEIEKYKTDITSTIDTRYNIQIINGDSAEQLSSMIRTLTHEQINLCAEIPIQNQSDESYVETKNSLINLAKVIDYNRAIRTQYIEESKADINRYNEWKELLNRISHNWSETVLTSAEMGWENMSNASSNASEFLEHAVQGRMDDLKSKVVADALEAKHELDSQMQEIEAEIGHKEEVLKTEITSQLAVVSMAKKTNNTLNNLHVSPTITLQIPVGMVSGGGGYVGQQGGSISAVTTSIRHESVVFENPAHHIRTQILELADSNYQIEKVRLENLTSQYDGLSNVIKNRKELIDERQKRKEAEIDERLEREKEITLKHAKSVESLFLNVKENGEKIDYTDLLRLVQTSWNRPSDLVSNLIAPINIMIGDIEAIMGQFEENSRYIEQILSPSSLSQYSSEKFYSHWISVGGRVGQGMAKINSIEVYQHNRVISSPSIISSIIPISINESLLLPISRKQFSQTLNFLMLKNSFGPRLTKILTKLKPDQIAIFQNNSTTTKAGVN